MEQMLDKLMDIKGYSYRVWGYDLGHSMLTIRATHKQKQNHNVHIIFVDVHYVQLPMGWEGDLYLASDEELIDVLNKTANSNVAGAAPLTYIKEKFSLYKADSPKTTVYILGHLSSIEHDVEPIYSSGFAS